MKITVTASTQKLDNMLSVADGESINNNPTGLPFDISIRNEDWAETIHLELWADATVTSWFPIKPWESFSFVTDSLSRVNLIGSGEITDCFLIIH